VRISKTRRSRSCVDMREKGGCYRAPHLCCINSVAAEI